MSGARRLRVLMVADPALPVPPCRYGGTQRVAAAVAAGLAADGHEVTLLAAPGSSVDGVKVVPIHYGYPAPRWRRLRWYLRFAGLAAWLSRHSDVLVSFWREDFLRGVIQRVLPVVLTHHHPITAPPPHRPGPTVRISVSDDQRSDLPTAGWRTIHNGIDVEYFTPAASRSGGYVAFLGRLSPEKGLDTAVRACLRAGLRLKVGGNLPDSDAARGLFDREVRPHLGSGVEWLGELDDAGKRDLLRGADALLFPIRWREAFGLVMAEALACGTPVIALRAGSTPEIVRDGVTGFLRDDEEGLVEALGRIGEIDRELCRGDAVARFSNVRMVDDYRSAIASIVREAL